jgi:hypothetical protein
MTHIAGRVFAAVLVFATSLGAVPASREIAVQAGSAFGSHVRAIAVAGPFAVVNVSGWELESSPYTGQTLFRKYRFGWQMIDLAEGRFRVCDLAGDGVPPAFVRSLSINASLVPAWRYVEPCSPARPFAPTSRDEDAVRAVIPGTSGQWFRNVFIADNYALILWAGGGGGPMIARKRNGRWAVYHGTGGMPSACWMIEFGNVPRATARRLMIAYVGDSAAARQFTQTTSCR